MGFIKTGVYQTYCNVSGRKTSGMCHECSNIFDWAQPLCYFVTITEGHLM